MPRLTRLLLALCLPALIAGCQLALPGPDVPGPDGKGTQDVTPNAVAGDAIEVTALDAGPAAAGVASTTPPTAPIPAPGPEVAAAQPDPAPVAAAAPAPKPDPAAEVPQTPKPAQQTACEKKGGKWTRAGKGALFACIQSTRDAGKQCSRESQCESQCLARSGTCAPFKPLLGCNEILQDNGARVTLCID